MVVGEDLFVRFLVISKRSGELCIFTANHGKGLFRTWKFHRNKNKFNFTGETQKQENFSLVPNKVFFYTRDSFFLEANTRDSRLHVLQEKQPWNARKDVVLRISCHRLKTNLCLRKQ